MGILNRKRILWLVSFLVYFFTANSQVKDAVEQYASNQAAIVGVRMEIQAEVNVQKININEKPFNRLIDSIQRLANDSIFLTLAEKLDIVLNQFQQRPQHFFVSEFSYFRHKEKVSARGSGFVISGDGYVLTNCHVIDEGDAFVSRRFILSAFNFVTESNIKALEQAWVVKFTEEQRSLLYKTYADVYSRIVPIELEKITKSIFVSINRDDELGRKISVDMPAIVVKKGRPMPGKDVALLKINPAYELPAIPLSKTNYTLVGEDIYAYGFPNSVAKNGYLSEETILEATLTRGIISAQKKSVKGWPVLQMDADINRGNSGGPVCNQSGEVIGISTFGTLDDNARALAPGLNFAIPLEVIREFIPDSVRIAQNDLSKLFGEAVRNFQKGYYSTALDFFEKVKARNPSYPDLNKFITRSKTEIDKGNDKYTSLWLTYSAFIAIFLLIAFLIWFKMRND